MEDKIFSDRKKRAIGLIHKVYITKLKNTRKYTASTRTRAEVQGGGKKPWKQKGTGNARAGSNRSPLWVGGGVIFGPKHRLVTKKINKKENRLALLSALFLKQKQFLFVPENTFETLDIKKTKELNKVVKDLFSPFSTSRKPKILILLEKPNPQLWIASRNLKNLEISHISCLNISQILRSDKIILSSSSFNTIKVSYGKQYL